MDWARKDLSDICANIAKTTFIDEFRQVVRKTKVKVITDSDELFKPLKDRIITDRVTEHEWSDAVASDLKVIQTTSLQDDELEGQKEWKTASDFMKG